MIKLWHKIPNIHWAGLVIMGLFGVFLQVVHSNWLKELDLTCMMHHILFIMLVIKKLFK